jgi:hypothetical protein
VSRLSLSSTFVVTHKNLTKAALLLPEIYFAQIDIQNNIDNIYPCKHPKKTSNSRSFKLLYQNESITNKTKGCIPFCLRCGGIQAAADGG